MPFAEGKFAWACEVVSVKGLNRYVVRWKVGFLCCVGCVSHLTPSCVYKISEYKFTLHVISLILDAKPKL